MFEKILVCLDGSSLAEQVVPYATEQALHFKSKVVLLQVLHIPGSVVAAPSIVIPGAYIPAAPVNVQDVEEEARIYLGNMMDVP